VEFALEEDLVVADSTAAVVWQVAGSTAVEAVASMVVAADIANKQQ
jgi:hypothetical protein